MKGSLLTLIVFCSLFCDAQKQGNMWFFGDHAGLDFSSGSPVSISGQTVGLCEGTASLCDSSGALLFYTDGTQLWNGNQQPMPNGDSLLGHWSSSQSAIIIPLPGSSRFFYVFTTDAFVNNLQNGFRYSIVDMCLDNGSGDVIPGQKNIFLLDTVSEKLTAVRHANGVDYWVITHKYFSNAFYSYHLSATGIIDTVISQIGSVHPINPQNYGGAIGQLKASPNGEKLAIVNGNNTSIAEYFSFDKSTGVISNCVSIQTNPNWNYYGVSFSPDNSKLYIACWLNGNGIYQFDLNAGGGNAAAVIASITQIAFNWNYLGLQLANNGKIYTARSPFAFNPYLGVINYPDSAGVSCNYVDSAVYLNGVASSSGFPNFIDSYDYSNTLTSCVLQSSFFTTENTLCPGTCTSFLNLSNNASYYQWYFPGASPDTSTDINPASICYQTPGNYDVQLIASNSNGSDTLTLQNYITVYPFPPPQSIIQSGDTLFAIAGSTSYLWFFSGNIIPGATEYYYVAPTSGNYSVVATDNNGCEVEAAITNVIAGLTPALYKEEGVVLFPNPVEEELIIKTEVPLKAIEISIYNLIGEKIPLTINCCPWTVDCRTLPPGLYYLELTAGEKIFRSKFVKQ